jgi:hypothetical protein
MRDAPPALVVSGINKGWNLGDDVTYSGTVSAALEGVLLGVPSIAVSVRREETFDFAEAARAAVVVAEAVLRPRMMVPGTSIIMAETDYSYRPPLRFLFPGNVSISHAAYRRSRLVDPIPRVS